MLGSKRSRAMLVIGEKKRKEPTFPARQRSLNRLRPNRNVEYYAAINNWVYPAVKRHEGITEGLQCLLVSKTISGPGERHALPVRSRRAALLRGRDPRRRLSAPR